MRARRVVRRAERRRKRRVKGLEGLAVGGGGRIWKKSYLRMKCGTRYMPGTSMKAGKVMRLKRPKTRRTPSIPDAKMDECSCSLSTPNVLLTAYVPHLIFHNPLD